MSTSSSPPAANAANAASPGKKASRAGRDLPAAIGVGLTLLIVVLIGILWVPWLLLVVVTAAVSFGAWEVARALRSRHIEVPQVPLQIGAIGIPVGTWIGALTGIGAEQGLAISLFGAVLVMVLYRVFLPRRDTLRAVISGTFILLWVPFLASFTLLLLTEPRGNILLATLLLLVVSNDTFGYIVGSLFGKHPLVPKISPKKSWEGFIGSILGACLIGVLCCIFLLQTQWWVGIILAVLTVAAATTGDLAESMIKRELGVKDMSRILPGHGGLMDRLDSVVFAAPVAYLVTVILSGHF